MAHDDTGCRPSVIPSAWGTSVGIGFCRRCGCCLVVWWRAIEDLAATYQGTPRERPLFRGRRLLISLQHPGQPHP